MAKKDIVDRFVIAAEPEDVKLSRHKPLPYIKPLEYNHFQISESSLEEIKIPSFNEEERYKDFLAQKEQLKKHYKPFLSEQFSEIEDTRENIKLEDFDFRFETEEDKKDFSLALNHKGKWEKIKLPHFVGPDGKYNVFYYSEIDLGRINENKNYILKFEASDYITDVYLNGRMIISHEGFFAPFYVDLTSYLIDGKNALLIVLHNELTTTGVGVDGQLMFGKKIYAATHFGYDEPIKGWHHCPAGVGIYGDLTLAITNKQRIEELYIRPDFDNSKVSGTIQIINSEYKAIKNTYLEISVEGRNFKEEVLKNKKVTYNPLQFDQNFVEFEFDIKDFKKWSIEEPYLYELIIKLFDKDGKLLDTSHEHFGMRKFISDENSKPLKGQFFFNNERVILNGTNEMGFLPLDVMRKNDDQLIDDIMAAKVAHLNMFRMTQRPVLRKVYDYFDMLGMFCQTDFPLFNYLSPCAMGETFKQVADMEKHVRNHPSCVIDSFCNEAFDGFEHSYENYVMSREDLEKTLFTLQNIVKIVNPDKVTKLHEGDQCVLNEGDGLTDFHIYCYWYVSQSLDSGSFEKGYLPGMRTGWMTGCGEYGVDGLDSYEIMQKYAPKEWLPKDINDPWVPKVIARAQCWPQLSDFLPEEEKILDWIRVSRNYQKEAIVKYVTNLRRRLDAVQYRAVHLLIDAWPMGWTKTLIDVDRIPKPAFYTFADANTPFMINLKRDRYVLYNDEKIVAELFALNDTAQNQKGTAIISCYENDKLVKTFKKEINAIPVNQNYSGDITFTPSKGFVGKISFKAMLTNINGEKTFDEAVFEVKNRVFSIDESPLFLTSKFNNLKKLFGNKTNENVIFTDDEYYTKNKEEIEKDAFNGKRIVVFFENSFNVLDSRIGIWKHTDPGMTRSNNWLMRNPDSELTKEFDEMDFRNFYDQFTDKIGLTARYKFYWPEAEEILFTKHDRGNPKFQFHKENKLVCGRKKYGKGEIIITSLENVNGFAGFNPTFDKFIQNLLLK